MRNLEPPASRGSQGEDLPPLAVKRRAGVSRGDLVNYALLVIGSAVALAILVAVVREHTADTIPTGAHPAVITVVSRDQTEGCVKWTFDRGPVCAEFYSHLKLASGQHVRAIEMKVPDPQGFESNAFVIISR